MARGASHGEANQRKSTSPGRGDRRFETGLSQHTFFRPAGAPWKPWRPPTPGLAPWAKFFRPYGPLPFRTHTFRNVQQIKKNALASTSRSCTRCTGLTWFVKCDISHCEVFKFQTQAERGDKNIMPLFSTTTTSKRRQLLIGIKKGTCN